MFSRRIALTLLAAASTSRTALAWSAQAATSRGFMGRSILSSYSYSSPLKKSSGSSMTMFFGSLFGGAGAPERTIDYSVLDHPGPELAEFAKQGLSPAFSEKNPNLALATFAGGCFWGLELAYQRVPGVVYTAVGYAQGPEEFPTYGQVCSGATGHTEAVMVYYDPAEVSYEQLMDTFFDRVNVLTVNGQGNDFGTQYRTGVYYHSPEQEAAAKARFSREQEKYKNRKIATECKPARPFWPAEKYHQQYLEKGGRSGSPQSATKGAKDTIRCYG